jgi:hypothetical protein
MKKILAIAVATAISAPAMADMTISGTVAVGYSTSSATYYTDATTYAATTTGVATTTRTASTGNGGFGVDTATLLVSASETLDNGLTVDAYMGVGALQRGGSVGGKDAGLTFSGDFGSVKIAAVELGNGVFGYGSSVAENFTGELSAAASNSDSISYTLPAFGPVTVAVSYDESGTGIGNGEDAGFSPSVKATYSDGALGGFVQYTSYDSALTKDNRLRLGVSFDAGVAVIKAATGTTTYEGATKDLTNTNVGVDFPMGDTTIGANYGTADNGTTDEAAWSVGMKHALSSNLSVSAKYTDYETGATTSEDKSSVLVSLSF